MKMNEVNSGLCPKDVSLAKAVLLGKIVGCQQRSANDHCPWRLMNVSQARQAVLNLTEGRALELYEHWNNEQGRCPSKVSAQHPGAVSSFACSPAS